MCRPQMLTLVLTLIAPTALAAPASVDLATLQSWDIVVPADAHPAERYAAEEFRTILQKAAGVDLPIRTEATGPDRHVFIGASAAMQASPVGFSTEGYGPEKLRIIVRDNLIAIAGGRPRGTLYGVYTFLEDYIGVRFLTSDHTHIPPLRKPSLVGPLDRTYEPVLQMRWSYYGETNLNHAFAARLRINAVPGDPRFGGKTGQDLINHSFGRQIPSQKYGKEHPEYFALRDGKRLAPVENDWTQTEPCLTHPDVLRIVTEAVLAELKANPHKENISVSQNDNAMNCQCPSCTTIDEREGTPMGSLLTFVNAVAEAVEREHPNVMVGTLSYWYSRKPPRTIRPRHNVQIQLCSIECCQFHAINDPDCPPNRVFCADMDAWGKVTSNIFIWNYNTNFSAYHLPVPNLRIIERNVRYFVERGAKGIFMQAAGDTTGGEFSDLRNYLIANLLWDPQRDGRRLIDEFLDLHYRSAAPPIRRYLNLLHDRTATGLHRNCYGDAAGFGVNEEIARVLTEAFGEAMRLADDDEVRARVEKASVIAYRVALELCWYLKPDQKLDPETATRLRPAFEKYFALCEKYQIQRVAEMELATDARKRLARHFEP